MKRVLKLSTISAHFITWGNSFQNFVAQVENALSPYFLVLVFGCASLCCWSDWRDLMGIWGLSKSASSAFYLCYYCLSLVSLKKSHLLLLTLTCYHATYITPGWLGAMAQVQFQLALVPCHMHHVSLAWCHVTGTTPNWLGVIPQSQPQLDSVQSHMHNTSFSLGQATCIMPAWFGVMPHASQQCALVPCHIMQVWLATMQHNMPYTSPQLGFVSYHSMPAWLGVMLYAAWKYSFVLCHKNNPSLTCWHIINIISAGLGVKPQASC